MHLYLYLTKLKVLARWLWNAIQFRVVLHTFRMDEARAIYRILHSHQEDTLAKLNDDITDLWKRGHALINAATAGGRPPDYIQKLKDDLNKSYWGATTLIKNTIDAYPLRAIRTSAQDELWSIRNFTRQIHALFGIKHISVKIYPQFPLTKETPVPVRVISFPPPHSLAKSTSEPPHKRRRTLPSLERAGLHPDEPLFHDGSITIIQPWQRGGVPANAIKIEK